MKMKRIALIVISVVMILFGALAIGAGAFGNMIIKMETSHTAWEFGPDNHDQFKTYDRLYDEALVIARFAHKSAMAFFITLTIGLFAIGIICALWAKDLKQLKKENEI